MVLTMCVQEDVSNASEASQPKTSPRGMAGVGRLWAVEQGVMFML